MTCDSDDGPETTWIRTSEGALIASGTESIEAWVVCQQPVDVVIDHATAADGSRPSGGADQ